MLAMNLKPPLLVHLLCSFASTCLIGGAYADEDAAFFEKTYKTKIVDVKPIEEYPDPDQFYSAIARQLGIQDLAFQAVEKNFGWKNDGKMMHQAIVKRGPGVWEFMVVRVEIDKATKRPNTDTMEMKMVMIDDAGKVEFMDPDGMAKGKKTESKTTNTNSAKFETFGEKKAFCERYVKFRRSYEELEFQISYKDGGDGAFPSPTEWDIRIVAKVPKDEIENWIADLKETKDADTKWITEIPNAPTMFDGFQWYEDKGKLVGLDRDKRLVLYRNQAN
jgi:hypothetical protein